MFCISISYTNADLNARSVFHCTKSRQPDLIAQLKKGNIPSGVYLSTCNRVELFGIGNAEDALHILSDFFSVSCGDISEIARVFCDEEAVKHLFYLCAGLKSMVKGEDEILGQIKQAYAFSKENDFCDNEINMAFQSAISCAKYIKTNTLISKSSVSVASLAATKIKNEYPSSAVLVIGGTGDTGEKVIRNLLSYGFNDIYCTLRKESELHPDIRNHCITVPYSERYAVMSKMQVILSATSSPHLTILSENIPTDQKKRLFIDLASPRDIDPVIKGNPLNTLLCLDDFRTEAENNRIAKKDSILEAEVIIKKHADEYLKHRLFNINYSKILKYFCYNDKKAYDFRDNSSLEEFKSLCEMI